jgi:hypothetical protein
MTRDVITQLPTATEQPGDGDVEQILRRAVAVAVQSPSGHNTQPWRFQVSGDRVAVFADRTRRLPVVDPEDRELVISCGAALAHLQIAVEDAGFVCEVEIPPAGTGTALLAVLVAARRIGRVGTRSAEVAAMADRRTNRNPFEDRPVPDGLLHEMQRIAAGGGAWLTPVRGAARDRLADLVAEGDRIQMADPAFRRELASWVRHNHSPARDGMRAHAFGVPDLLSRLAPVLVRRIDTGRRQAAKDRRLTLGSPLVVVLGTDQDTIDDWLATGQVLARVLLAATLWDVSASFVDQPVEVPPLRNELAALIGTTGAPQLVLRMGYGPPVLPQPRRPVGEVLSI